MKVAVLGGAGLMGRVIARTLVEHLGSEAIVAVCKTDGRWESKPWQRPKRTAGIDAGDAKYLVQPLQRLRRLDLGMQQTYWLELAA